MKSTPCQRKALCSAALSQTLALMVCFSVLLIALTEASPPAWWKSRGATVAPLVTTNGGVVTTNYLPNDYTIINQGQLKQFTKKAVDELNANLAGSGGAGTDLNNLVLGWTQDYATNGYGGANLKPSDFTLINVGQLKYVGNKVWAQLVAAGYTNSVPSWLQQNTNSDNALANIGQAKSVFNFILAASDAPTFLPGSGTYAVTQNVIINSSVPGSTIYYTTNGATPTTSSSSLISGGSVAVSSSETVKALAVSPGYAKGPVASAAYVIQALQTPVLQIVSGNGQVGLAGQVLAGPLVVRVLDQTGQPMASASVQFTVTLGGGQISTTSMGSLSGSCTVSTDVNGLGKVYLAPMGATGTVNQVTVGTTTGAAGSSVVFGAIVGTASSNPTPTPGGSGTGPTADPNPSGVGSTTFAITITPAPYTARAGGMVWNITGSGDSGLPYDHRNITISWPAVSGATNYEVYRMDGLTTTLIYTGSGISCADSDLFSKVDYRYQVSAQVGTDRITSTTSYSVPFIEAIAIHWGYYDEFGNKDEDFDLGWTESLFSNGIPFSYYLEHSDIFDNPDPDDWEASAEPDSYKFIFNPSRTGEDFIWYEIPDLVSRTVSTTDSVSEAYDIDADEVFLFGLSLGLGVTDGSGYPFEYGSYRDGKEPGGIISSSTGFEVDMGMSDIDTDPEIDEKITITWVGNPSNTHFDVSCDGDGIFYPSESIASGFELSRYSDLASLLAIPDFNFTVTPIEGTAQPGDQITITVTDNYFGSKTFTYTYKGSVPDYSMSIDEASGPKYRKIALNGLPMADEKPQQTGETDQEQEETYIDALTAGLRHSTTDVYLPVSGSDFSLSARRDFRSEVWNTKSGLRPHESPDRPFGLCWSSNLAPNIHFVKSNNPQKSQPDQAIVTDETGAVHSFYIWPGSGGTLKFFPMPTAKNEQQTPNLESLTANATSPVTYTFTRKYGSTLTYAMTPLTLAPSENRYQGSAYTTTNTYARLTQAVDRLGNTLNYTFNQANDLVPETIAVANQPDIKIYIHQTPTDPNPAHFSQNLVDAIWDAQGNKTTFHYTQATQGDTLAYYLSSVVTPDGATTQYGYDIASETDTTPQPTTPSPPPYWHADLSSITDPLNHGYTITYVLDKSKDDYMNNASLYQGYYTKCGLPRNVSSVTMPDGTSSSFVNASVMAVGTNAGALALANVSSIGQLTFPGQHQLKVTDATGFHRTYRFGTPQVVPLPQFKTLTGSANMSDSKIVCYQSLSIDEGDSTTGTYLGTEAFQFDLSAGMALKQITDFSGNVTTFVHGDAWSAPADYRTIMTDTTVNGYYSDPTSQTDALGQAKTFTYSGLSRIMQSVVDENGNKTSYGIDSLGRRTAEKKYDAANHLLQETDFAYGNSAYPGFMTQKTVAALGGSDPSWAQALVTTYTPDANGRVAQEIVDPSGLHLVTTDTYDANGNKLTATDPKGNTTWFSYDARNRLVTVTNADGSQKQMVYDVRGNKTKEYDENGIATLYAYDNLNRLLTQARDMNGNGVIDSGTDLVTSYTYNAANSKLTTTDPNGNLTQMAYDNLQRVTSITDALSHVTQFQYGTNSGGNTFDSSSFKPTHTVDPRGFTTDATYDALYRPLAKAVQYDTGASPSTTSTVYDHAGNPVTSTDPLGRLTTTAYDGLDRPVLITAPDSTTVQSFYTSTGFKWKVIDQNNNATQTAYDPAGRPVSVTSPPVDRGDGILASAVTQTYYDAAGNAVETVNPLGQAWDYAFDAHNRKVQAYQPTVADAANSGAQTRPVLTWLYDPAGRTIGVIDARGHETDTVYDAANRVTDVNAPSVAVAGGSPARPNTHSGYDKNGNVLTLRDPNSHTTTNTYDALNRLLTTSVTPSSGVTITVTNTYDQVDNKLTVKDGKSQTTRFTYDGLNRLLTTTDAAGKTTTLSYDALNKTGRTDALGQVTAYQYDNRNRLQHVIYTSGAAANSQRNYAYDNVGNLLSVAEPTKTEANVAYAYDALNRATAETSNGRTHAYVYDLAGNRLKTTYGGSGLVIASSYDALNRLSQMVESGRTTSYHYDLDGNIVEKDAPNGDAEISSYDALNRAQELSGSHGVASLYDYQYGYDLAGNVRVVAETYPGGLSNRTVANVYDDTNRLLTETVTGSAPNAVTTYAYDNANNRSSKVITGSGASSTSYTYNSLNQPTGYTDSTRSVALTYDLNGNRATRVVSGGADNGTDTYSYDFENRLIGLVKGSGGGAGTYAYAYDYRTRRITRDETGASAGYLTHLVYSGGTSVAEYNGSATTPAVEYLRGSDYGGGVGGILYTLRSGTPSYTHENKRGDVIAKTNASGTLTYQSQYEAFGKEVATTGSTPDRQKSNSKDCDPTGLVDEGFRYRDLETGMFISRDPAGFVDGPNLYTYVIQNPWTKFDPEGLQMAPLPEMFLRPTTTPLPEEYIAPRTAPQSPAPTTSGSGTPTTTSPAGQTGPAPVTTTGPNTNGQTKPEQSQRDENQKPDVAYRGGNNTNQNFTPRPGKDDVAGNPKAGLSLMTTPQAAAPRLGDKAQEVDLNKIDRSKFNVVKTPDGHVSITPKTQEQLQEWSASRPDADKNPHPYTQDVRGARTGSVWVNGPGGGTMQTPQPAPTQPAPAQPQQPQQNGFMQGLHDFFNPPWEPPA